MTHPEGMKACLSADGTRHELLLRAPAKASHYSFAVSRIVPSSLRLAGLGRFPRPAQILVRDTDVSVTFTDPKHVLRGRRNTSVMLTGWAKDLDSGLNVCFEAHVAVC